MSRLSSSDLVDVLGTPFAPDVLAGELGSAVVVDLTDVPDVIEPSVIDTVLTLPVLLVGLTGQPERPGSTGASLVDVLLSLDDAELDVVLGRLEANPLASISLALLLRASEQRSVPDGLVAESATYSMLQGGPEFARWRGQPAAEEEARRPSPDGSSPGRTPGSHFRR